MNADIRIPNSRFELQHWCQRGGLVDVRIRVVHLRRSGADEREGNGVISRLAALQTCRYGVRMCWEAVVPMGREPMAMLGMIVIAVDVGVGGGRTRRRRQDWDEQQSQDPVHEGECMRRGHVGQKKRCRATNMPEFFTRRDRVKSLVGGRLLQIDVGPESVTVVDDDGARP
jgi:hypothetical protein